MCYLFHFLLWLTWGWKLCFCKLRRTATMNLGVKNCNKLLPASVDNCCESSMKTFLKPFLLLPWYILHYSNAEPSICWRISSLALAQFHTVLLTSGLPAVLILSSWGTLNGKLVRFYIQIICILQVLALHISQQTLKLRSFNYHVLCRYCCKLRVQNRVLLF